MNGRKAAWSGIFCGHKNAGTTALLVALSLQVAAQAETGQPEVIEEVFVTAQKREQSIRDVPISLYAVTEAFLSEKGITDFSELSNFVPNVKLRTDVGVNVSMNVRGFAKQSGNTAFDQAVGLLIDGVPYNDNDYFQTGMVDIARIEVLRGPQGTLMGKNTTAGLLNITTKRPTDEYNGYIDAQGGDYDQQRIEAAFGGPVIEGLNFRIAAVDDQRDGIMRNTTADITEDGRAFFPGVPKHLLTRDRSSLRLKFEAPDLFGSLWGMQLEYADLTSTGNAQEILLMDDNVADYLRQFDPNLNTTPGDYINSINDPSFSDRTVKKAVLYNEASIGDWGLTTTFGWAKVDGIVITGDATPAPLFGFIIETSKPQRNLDIVLTSPSLFDGAIDMTAGFFFENRHLGTKSVLDLNTEPLAGLLVANNQNSPGAPPTVDNSSGFPIGNIDMLPGGLDVVDESARETSTSFFSQRAEAMALYGQLAWHFAERWTLNTGLRVSNEEKTGAWNQVFNTDNVLLTENVLNYEEFTRELERDETTVQPKLSLNFKPIENVSLFLHWARGFRSGGFNQAGARDNGLEYDREVVNEYAFNAKTRLLEGALEFNFGIFHMELDDFQLLTTGPNDLAAVAVNAGQARARGVELDFRWIATRWLSVAGAVGYNDSEFTDFPFGPCAADGGNKDGDADDRCDLTGDELPNAAPWSATLLLNGKWPLADFGFDSGPLSAIDLTANISAEYQALTNTGLPGDDRYIQPAYTRFDAGIGLAGENWTFRITGKNLRDEAINRRTVQIPLTNDIVQHMEPPRTVYAQFRWDI